MGIRYKFITLFTICIHAAVSLAQGAELEIPLADKTTTQSSTSYQGVPERAVDGNTDGNWDMGSCTHTRGGEPGGWWMIDLEKKYRIEKVAIYNRINPAFTDRLDGAIVRIGDDPNRINPICSTVTSQQIANSSEIILPCDMLIGQYVSIELSSSVTLTLCEVKLYGNEYYKTTTCESGWTFYQESCYQLMDYSTNWSQAKIDCAAAFAKSYIAVFNSEEEYNFVISEIIPTGYFRFWIGCNDVVTDGHWVCEDSSGAFYNDDGTQQGYWRWGGTEPKGRQQENCLERRNLRNEGWNDIPCKESYRFVCEYKLRPEETTTSSLTTEGITKKGSVSTESALKVRLTPMSYPDRELRELADVNVTAGNVFEVARNLSVLVERNVEIDNGELEYISTILTDIVAIKDPSLDVTEAVVETVDSIIESYVGETRFDNKVTSVPEASNQIQRNLEQQITTLQTSPGNSTIKERNLAIQVVKVPEESVVSRRLVFEVTPEGQNKTLNTNVKTVEAREQPEVAVEAAISFQLAIDLYSKDNTSIPISFFVYNEATLFPSTLLANNSSVDVDKDDVKRIVASRVISATVEGLDVKNLPEDNPVETHFALNRVNEYEGNINRINAIECVYWDITASNGLGDWSRDGCKYIKMLSDGRVVCHCNHLTSFAVLVDIHGQRSLVLDILSKVGCGISIACLLITLITYLSSRSLRRVKPKQILISFCFSLLFLYVVFVIGIERGTKLDVGCITVAALLHYFTLTSITWMAVEAFQMYGSFVKVVGRWTHISRFLLKASLVAWGFPAVIVIVVLIVDVNQYNNEDYCFLKIGYAFYFTHLLILALVVVFNTIIFGLVMHSLTCGRKTTSKQDKRQETLRRVQNAIAISLLMGLTWVFGLFALIHEDSSLVFQFFFCIFNSLQGACIFVMFCVRQPDVVAIWKELLSCSFREKKDHTNVDISQSSGNTGRTATASSDMTSSKM